MPAVGKTSGLSSHSAIAGQEGRNISIIAETLLYCSRDVVQSKDISGAGESPSVTFWATITILQTLLSIPVHGVGAQLIHLNEGTSPTSSPCSRPTPQTGATPSGLSTFTRSGGSGSYRAVSQS